MHLIRSIAIASILAACGNPTPSSVPTKSTARATAAGKVAATTTLSQDSKSVCNSLGSGLQCLALGRLDSSGKMWTSSAPVAGYGADDLVSAYAIPTAGGDGVTVALIEFGDDPSAEDDLAVYRSQNGLPACVSLTGCFTKVDEYGNVLSPTYSDGSSGAASQPTPPPVDYGWAVETSLDLDMVSAACPKCKILLVEGNEGSTIADFISDATNAMNTAANLGAKILSNSWQLPEQSAVVDAMENALFQKLSNAGVSVFASSGDSGFGTGYPASSGYVIATGGTNLVKDGETDRGWSETAWSFGGSGCSAYIPKPAWQTDSACPQRMVADLSAVADPATGVAVYFPEEILLDDVGDTEIIGVWGVIGGTSVSAPLIAGMWAASGLAGTQAQSLYSDPASDFNDITAGGNGICSNAYQCSAVTGYDGPTGVGTPISNAF